MSKILPLRSSASSKRRIRRGLGAHVKVWDESERTMLQALRASSPSPRKSAHIGTKGRGQAVIIAAHKRAATVRYGLVSRRQMNRFAICNIHRKFCDSRRLTVADTALTMPSQATHRKDCAPSVIMTLRDFLSKQFIDFIKWVEPEDGIPAETIQLLDSGMHISDFLAALTPHANANNSLDCDS